MEKGHVYQISHQNKQLTNSGTVNGSYIRSEDIWNEYSAVTASPTDSADKRRTCESSHWKCVLVVVGVLALVLTIVLILAAPLWIDGEPDASDTSTLPSDVQTDLVAGRSTTSGPTLPGTRPPCKSGFFECNDGTCIRMSFLCNARQECSEGEDELNCGCRGFQCADGSACLQASQRCDTIQQCADGSDETECICSSSEYEVPCDDGGCILREWLCDGVPDCNDASDEVSCSANACSETEFECADHSMCINGSERCDGTQHCPDNSDEIHCVKIIEEDILMVGRGLQFVPACADNWREEWSRQVCVELSAGTVASSGTVSSINSSDIEGFAQSKLEGFSSNSTILNMFEKNISASCDTNEVVTISCSYDECGTRAKSFTESSPRKILNGNTASPGKWPWQVMLFDRSTFQCGGVLISGSWVLTAAHCIEMAPNKPARFTVTLGTVSKSETASAISISAKRLFTHEKYDTKTLENDIALIELQTSVNYTDFIRPICVPPSDYNVTNEVECYTTGWGAIDDQADITPTYLQEAKMLLINDTFCANDPDIAHWGLYKEVMLCAGYVHGYITVCTGDSGGPLVCRNHHNQWSVAGITSWGPVDDRTACKGISVFTEVIAFTEWISNTVLLS